MDAVGGGILVAAAAVLWISYLLPSWLRRRQYLATERNAVRLQQTLRILAETAETPEEVRLEATARAAASQQRVLREREEKLRLEAEAAELVAETERRAAAIERKAAEAAAREALKRAEATAERMSGRSGRNLRRQRGLCSLVMLASLLVAGGGSIATAFGGTWLVPIVAGLTFAGGFVGVAVLARASRPVDAPASSTAPVAETERAFEPIDVVDPTAVTHEWSPRPLPKPLHLSRGTVAATAMASIDAASELRRAAAESERDARAAELAPDVPPLRPHPQAPAASAPTDPAQARPTIRTGDQAMPSRYAAMGIVEPAEGRRLDLDEVLRRRRVAS
jgi:hypothetical protein